jgi:uncharacterized protein YPO0396
MSSQHRDELIGRIYRHKTADRERVSFIDAELASAVCLFKKASSQLEALLAKQPSEIDSVLSRIHVNEILKLLGERRQIERRISEANEQLRNLGVRPKA